MTAKEAKTRGGASLAERPVIDPLGANPGETLYETQRDFSPTSKPTGSLFWISMVGIVIGAYMVFSPSPKRRRVRR